MMKRAYVYRIYPGKNQEVRQIRTLNTCRHLYNNALAERKRQAELNRLKREFQVFPWGKPEWLSYEDQANRLAGSKTPYQREVYSQVLQNALKRLDRSFQNFFRGNGYPRFKGRNRYNTFTYPQSGFGLDENNLYLAKIGTVRILYEHLDRHRRIEGTIKTCTVKRDVDQWYAIFTTEIDREIKKVSVVTKRGIDVGLESLLTLSSGETIAPPKFLRISEAKLSWEQRKLSRKELGSNNRDKQRIAVAKAHRKIRNQRKDFNHKTSRWLVDTADHNVFEKLQIRNMMANHRLAKSIADAGWYQLQTYTAYKAGDAGRRVDFCTPNGTTQRCSGCESLVPKGIGDRMHVCPVCGLVLRRDHNSAINIRESISIPADCREYTPVETRPLPSITWASPVVEAGSPVL